MPDCFIVSPQIKEVLLRIKVVSELKTPLRCLFDTVGPVCGSGCIRGWKGYQVIGDGYSIGKADLFLRLGVTGEWDTGASQYIVTEAGGNICSANFQPLTYNLRNSLENPDLLVLGDQRVGWQHLVNY